MFQTHVNQQPAPAEAGDFAGANPRASLPAPANGYRAGTDPIVVGRFAWGNPDTGIAESNAANGGLVGFVHRENQTIITEFLDESRLVVEAGFPVTLMSRGDFWAAFPGGADVGDAVYALDADGTPQTSDTNATLTPYVVASSVAPPAVSDSDSTIDAETGVLNIVSAPVSGAFEAGQVITGTGISGRAVITGQLTGTPGGIGTYATNYLNRVAVTATTITGTAGDLAKISTWAQAAA